MWGLEMNVETMTTTKLNTCKCGNDMNIYATNKKVYVQRVRFYEASNRRKAIYNNVEAHIKRFNDGLHVLSDSGM